MSKEVKTLYVTDGEDGVRVDRFFKRRWPHVNHVQLNKLLRSGQVRVDGGRVKADTRLTAGATVRVPPLPDAPSEDQQKRERAMLSPQEIKYARSLVIYEDEDVIALNKPSGLAVQGGTKTKNHVDRLLSAWGEGLERPRLVHRLDRDTSGVLLLGKSPSAAARLAGAFAKRRAHKTYWALVAGTPKPEEGYIDTPLVKKGFHDREIVQVADPKEPGAEVAETEYVTLSHAGPRVSWMALRPHTGRTHQLRAHMQAIGHSILGDPKYGDEASRDLSAGLGLQLHHRRIELPHPVQGTLIIEAPLDPVIKAGFERFGFDIHDAEADPFAKSGKKAAAIGKTSVMTYRAEPPPKASDQLGFRPKRFWQIANVVETDGGFAVALDGRPVKTPQARTLRLPSRALAEAVASEWDGVKDHVEYADMPLTRLGFAAVDRMDEVLAETIVEVLRYAETDLLCYPSEYPEALIARENTAWLPLLDWAEAELGLVFRQNRSLVHRAQPPETSARLGSVVSEMSVYARAGLMSAIPLFGSVVLALAVWRGRLSGEAAFAASRVGEDFQAETWGRDEEAAKRSESMKTQARSLEVWFRALC